MNIVGIIYLSIPLFIFFIGFLKPLFGIVFSLGLMGLIFGLIKNTGTFSAISKKAFILIMSFSLVITFVAGIGDLFFASKGDWLKHYFVIRDLSVYNWSVEYMNMGCLIFFLTQC